MPAAFANHYEVLDLPLFATRGQIRKAYRRGLHELDDVRTSAALQQAAGTNPLIERSLVVPASDSLRVFLSDDVLKSWHSINEVITTRVKPKPRKSLGEHAHSLSSLPTPQAIIHRNELDDAYHILAHPLKKKVCDNQHWRKLQPYESRRIAERVVGHQSQQTAIRQARKWRASMDHGHESDTKFWEVRFNRVRDLADYSGSGKCTIASSMASGEVVAAFVDTMDL
ncbi:hypothetical protein LTR85_009565 [Meristemomyces frigidus]|nr:hypothetical protein LTR85_009565 [Meristemomyces frigidus]